MAAYSPINNTWWLDYKVRNGENANHNNLNRAVDGLRYDVFDLYYRLYGGTEGIPPAFAGDPGTPAIPNPSTTNPSDLLSASRNGYSLRVEGGTF